MVPVLERNNGLQQIGFGGFQRSEIFSPAPLEFLV